MAENKKYYWLKLKEDFFKDKEIKKLRRIAGGDTYTIIYLKLLLLALRDNGKLYFEGIEDSFAEELALEIDEDEENVQVTMMYMIKMGLLQEISEKELFLTRLPECVGKETRQAEIMRKKRARQAIESNNVTKNGNDVTANSNNVISALPDVTKSYTEIEIEKEIDIDIENRVQSEEADLYTQLCNKYGKSFVDERVERSKNYKNITIETIALWCEEDFRKRQDFVKQEPVPKWMNKDRYNVAEIEKDLISNNLKAVDDP